jgi:hypothetical protein
MLFSDVFETHYQPWQDVFQYGPGTEIPGVTTDRKRKRDG